MPREVPQHLAALSKANAARLHRAALRADLKAGVVNAGAVVMLPKERERAIPVFDLLTWCPRIGGKKAQVILRDVKVAESAEVGRLSPRQRRALAERFGAVDGGPRTN